MGNHREVMMGREVDLMKNYPKSKRDISVRSEHKSEEVRAIARRFDREFFDGDRKHGYGGYNYNPRFWQPVIPDFQKHYQLTAKSSVLDIGCGKGFMMHDMAELIPGIKIKGVDISDYAIKNTIEDMRPHTQVANATHLPFPDDSFDLVIAINTLHNLEGEDLVKGLQEVERVSKGKSFIVMDAYRNEDEKEAMLAWNLTAKTVLHVHEWIRLFKEVGYTGDYFWFVP